MFVKYFHYKLRIFLHICTMFGFSVKKELSVLADNSLFKKSDKIIRLFQQALVGIKHFQNPLPGVRA